MDAMERKEVYLRIGGARILFQDVSARNGVVLALDRLLPAPEEPTPSGLK